MAVVVVRVHESASSQLCHPHMKSATIRNNSQLIFSLLSKSKEEFQTMRNSGGQTARSPILAELDVRGLTLKFVIVTSLCAVCVWWWCVVCGRIYLLASFLGIHAARSTNVNTTGALDGQKTEFSLEADFFIS